MQGVLSTKKVQMGFVAIIVAAIVALGMGLGAQPAYATQNNTMPVGSSATITKDGVKYKVANKGGVSGLTLTKVSGTKAKKSLTLPEELTYKGVTYEIGVIGKQAFKGTKLKTVKLPSNVWKIKAKAFKGSKIKKVILTTGKTTSTGKVLAKKANLKKSMKGSKVKTVKCAGAAKALKAKYKKALKKSNSGKKVKVK